VAQAASGWGGRGRINAIQIAARPPGMKAILPGEATEDPLPGRHPLHRRARHLDDTSFHGGQPAITRPDYPLDEKSLAERFDAPPWSLLYKKQQRDGPFWQVSLFPARYDRIEVPVLMIGGWYDGYRDSIPRMLEKLKAPSWGIVGPWNHSGPDSGRPGPAIEWRREAVRFFDQFLKGKDTGFSKQPRLAVYVRHSYPPGADRTTIPGEWRYEEGWPIRRSKETTLHLTPDHALAPAAVSQQAAHALGYVPSTGEEAVQVDAELDASAAAASADGQETSDWPLPEGRRDPRLPKALLRGSADAPLANWFARLSDVAPDGGHARDRRRALGGAAGIRVTPGPVRPRQDVPSRSRDALHVVGLPEGSPRAPGRLQRPLADDLADALGDDDAAFDRWDRRIAARTARDPARGAPGARIRRSGALGRGGRGAVHRGRLAGPVDDLPRRDPAGGARGLERDLVGAVPLGDGGLQRTDDVLRRRRAPVERAHGWRRRDDRHAAGPQAVLEGAPGGHERCDELSLQARAAAAKGRRAHPREVVG
jgi:hypothetical protein